MTERNKKSMKKQLVTSLVCLLLLLMMLLSSTLAWFTDVQYTHNVMEAGKISIKQTQNGERGFPTGLVLMPTLKVDNVVTVENTGNQPCYARTLFAFEDTADGSVLAQLELSLPNGVQILIPSGEEKIQFTVVRGEGEDAYITIYTVGYYLHDAKLEKDTSYTCLNAITLKGDAKNEWHMATGAQYDFFVLSQATQVTGLGDDAEAALDQVFGDVTAVNAAKWFALVVGGSVAEGGTEVTVPPANNP